MDAKTNVPMMGQGPAQIITPDSEESNKDELGITNPNLHRRVDPHDPDEHSDETSPREYYLGVHGVNSYRTTRINYHDEESETCEIP